MPITCYSSCSKLRGGSVPYDIGLPLTLLCNFNNRMVGNFFFSLLACLCRVSATSKVRDSLSFIHVNVHHTHTTTAVVLFTPASNMLLCMCDYQEVQTILLLTIPLDIFVITELYSISIGGIY